MYYQRRVDIHGSFWPNTIEPVDTRAIFRRYTRQGITAQIESKTTSQGSVPIQRRKPEVNQEIRLDP
jgi:hypothetical protein